MAEKRETIEMLTMRHYLNQLLKKESEILCINKVKNDLAMALRNAGHRVISIEADHEDLTVTQFRDQYFDVVICIGAVERYETRPQRHDQLWAFLRVLKLGGLFAMTYRNRLALVPYALRQGDPKMLASAMDENAMKKYPTPQQMQEELEQCNAHVLRHVGLDQMAYMMAEQLTALPEEMYEQYMAYHLKYAAEPSTIGMSRICFLIATKTMRSILCYGLNPSKPIGNINEWKNLAASEQHAWLPGDFAYELAKQWFVDQGEGLRDYMMQNRTLSDLRFMTATPIYKTKLENSTKNYMHELAITARSENKDIFISVDARRDETFGMHTTQSYYKEARGKTLIGYRGNACERIEYMGEFFAGAKNKLKMMSLRYELLETLLAVFIEAERQHAKEAVFLVKEVGEEHKNEIKIEQNLQDLTAVIRLVDENATSLKKGELIGPLDLPGSRIRLYIGYC